MSFKRKSLVLAFSLLLAASLLGCLMAVAYFFIPSYVESRLIPEITARLGGDDITFKIRSIHFNGTDLGPIIIGDPKQPALEAEAVRIDYTPAQLYKGHVEHIVISGVTLHARYQDGEFAFRGIDIKKIFERLGSGEKSGAADREFADAIALGGLVLRNAMVEVVWGEKTFRIPLEIRLTPENARLDLLNFEISCYPRGGKVTAAGRVDLKASTVAIDFHAEAVELARYADFSDLVPGLELTGRMDIKGRAVCRLQPFNVSTFSAAALCRKTRIIHSRVTLANPRDSQDSETPIHIELNGNSGNDWVLSISRFAMVTPIPAHFDSIDCKIKIGSDTVESAGTFSFGMAPSVMRQPLPVTSAESIIFKGRFEASWAAPSRWKFMFGDIKQETRSTAAKEIPVFPHGIDITTNMPAFEVSGSGSNEKGTADFKLNIPEIKVNVNKTVLSTAGITLKGNARFEDLSSHPKVSSDFDLSAKALKYKMNTTNAAIPQMTVHGKISGNSTGIDRLDAQAKFVNGTASDGNLKLRADGIRGRMPVHWPLEGKGEKGSVSVSGIKWHGRALGSVATVFQQKDRVFDFSGTHVSRVLPDLRLHFSGHAGLSPVNEFETSIDFKIPGYNTPGDLDLGAFIPSAKGLQLGGELELAGRYFLNAKGAKSKLRTALHNGRLSFEEMGLAVTGIDFALTMPDLFQMRSAPAQRLRFQTARLGELKMDTGRVELQFEPDGSLFIEKGSFEWCGGHVDTDAMRISPDRDDYRMVLYCDRLLLSKILEQFGAVQAEGSGTLNGKIPVRLENGRLSFDNGFLYSSPGEGGRIRLSGTEILTAGIPKNTLQYTQLELAREALKDYTYKWVKLALNSEDDTLLLRMQMDGKPAKALPFVYDKKIGGFVKVKTGGQGSIFQGISLDVNFNLPLDKLLTYKDIF